MISVLRAKHGSRRRDLDERLHLRIFIGVSVILFAASATWTIMCSASMSAMGGMPMPGDWTLSMTWMRMSGQRWSDVAADFLGMWTVMMVAMMLPSVMPALWRHQQVISAVGEGHFVALTAPGYFAVWTIIGIVIFPLGVGIAHLAMYLPAVARAIPASAGIVIVMIGALQFSAWKARRLACCRSAPADAGLPGGAKKAWLAGMRHGVDCAACCGNLMAIVLVIDVMDLATMALVTLAIAMERLAPSVERVARAIGIILVTVGAVLIAHAFAIV